MFTSLAPLLLATPVLLCCASEPATEAPEEPGASHEVVEGADSVYGANTFGLSHVDPEEDEDPETPAGFDHSHAVWTEVLAEHVQGDRFDYAALKKDPAKLTAYIETLRAVDAKTLASFTDDQRMAFWINVYNAHVVQLIVDNYPVKSIRDLGTLVNKVWNKRFIQMPALHPDGKNKNLSLDDVEHKILRPRFEDARVHAAVNCASISCPPLRNEAFVAARLDAQLDEQVRLWLQDTTRNRFDVAKGKLEVSKIFDSFKGDFVRESKTVQAWIAKYAPEDVAAFIESAKKVKVSYLDYSWKLNDVPKK